jgi:hypothetical protein
MFVGNTDKKVPKGPKTPSKPFRYKNKVTRTDCLNSRKRKGNKKKRWPLWHNKHFSTPDTICNQRRNRNEKRAKTIPKTTALIENPFE